MPSTNTWIGGSGDWSLGANWSNGTPPGTLDEALFNTAVTADLSNVDYENIASLSMATGNATLDVEGEVTIGGAHLNNVANFIDTTEGALLIDGGGVIAGQFITSAVGSIALSAGGTYQWNGQGSSQNIDMGTGLNDTLQFSTEFGGTVSDFNAGDIISYSGTVNSVVIGNNLITFNASNGQTYTITLTGAVYNASDMIVDGNVIQSTTNIDTWLAGTGNWSAAADWSNGVPTSASQVTIGALANAAVTLGASTTIMDLTIDASDSLTTTSGAILTVTGSGSVASGATLSLAGGGTFGGGLDIAGAVKGSGTLSLTGGDSTIESGATLSVANWSMQGAATSATIGGNSVYGGAFSASAGATLALASGNLNLTGSSKFSGAAVNGAYALYTTGTGASVASLLVGGTVAWTNSKTVTQAGGSVKIGDASGAVASIHDTSTGIWNIGDDSGIGHGASTASSMTNAGLFAKTGGTGTSTIAASFVDTATGTVNANTGTLSFTGPSNSFAGAIGGVGTVLFAGGTTTFNSGMSASVANLTETGAATVIALAEPLTYANAFNQGANASLSIASGVKLTLSGTTSLAGKVTGAGTLFLSGGATTISAGPALSVSNWFVSGAGTSVTVSGNRIYSGAFSEVTSATLTLQGGNLNLSGSAKFSGVTVNGSGTLFTAGTGATVSKLTIGGTVTWSNTTAVNQSAGLVTIGDAGGAAAVIRNQVGGAWDIDDDSGIGHGASTASAMINSGTLEKVAGAGTSAISASFTEAATGDVIADTGTLAFSGPINNFQGAIGGAGTVSFAGGSSTLSGGGAVTVGVLAETGGGTLLSVAEDLTLSNVFNQGANAKLSIASGDDFSLEGTATLGGSVSGPGSLLMEGGVSTIASGAKISVANWLMKGAGATLDEAVTYAGNFTEFGGATVDLAGGNLYLTGAANLSNATVDGAHALYTMGTGATVGGLEIGETVTWMNTAAVTQTGGDVTIGDIGNGVAIIHNTATGVWNITDDSGISLGDSASYMTNAGLFDKTGGAATSAIAPAMTNTGTIEVDAATLDLQGAVSGTGLDKISANTNLEFDSTVSAGQTVSFTGGGAELILGSPQGFAGKIGGFDAGWTSDAISVVWPWTFAGFAENAGGTQGTLAFTNGSTHIGITLSGDYVAAQFNAQTQASGVLITYG